MKPNYRRVLTRFGPEVRFELKPVVPAPFRAVEKSRFEWLKNELLRERLEALPEARLNSEVRRAANEAESLAWVTPYPLLVFPVLFEEKASHALRRTEHQERVYRLSRELLVA